MGDVYIYTISAEINSLVIRIWSHQAALVVTSDVIFAQISKIVSSVSNYYSHFPQMLTLYNI